MHYYLVLSQIPFPTSSQKWHCVSIKNALQIFYWLQVWSLAVVTNSFCKDLIDITLADEDAETFFMTVMLIVMLLLMTLTMLLKTFLICYSFGRMFILGPIVCDFFIRSVHYEWLDQCFVKQSKSWRTGAELFARSHELLYSSYAAVSRYWETGGDWILVWNQYFIITKTQHIMSGQLNRWPCHSVSDVLISRAEQSRAEQSRAEQSRHYSDTRVTPQWHHRPFRSIWCHVG